LQEAYDITRAYRETAATAMVSYQDLRVEAGNKDIRLVGKQGVPARLTHWAFGQLSQKAGAPAGYLRKLPATLAAQNLNYGIKERSPSLGDARLLLHRVNGDGLDYVLRAATSEQYERIWNHEVFGRLQALEAKGWRVPPARSALLNDPRARPATEEDILTRGAGSFSVEVGDMIAPAGIYASDHDMFAFLINEDRVIKDGRGNSLARGFFAWNSEVGAKSLGIMTFLYAHICGNHIVWGAQEVKEMRIRHVGKGVGRRFDRIQMQLREYADSSASDDEAKIKRAQTFELGASKEEALDTLLGHVRRRRLELTESNLEEAYDLVERREDDYGSPRSVWGLANGLTQLSQREEYAEVRTKIDRAAGNLLEIAF
jgi:hypothetical protein